jgi:hypothetical protein
MSEPARVIRLSQTLVPFGVGAIYDLRGESLIGCDTTYWKGKGQKVRSRRLAAALGVDGFRSAPSQTSLYGSSGPTVPYFRFPQWLFCQRCRGMTKWSIKMEIEGEAPKCGSCAGKPQLVPMRFVIACKSGHLGDVPWEFWAHFKAEHPHQKQCKSKNLKFIDLGGVGAGLQSLVVECKTCKAKRPMGNITGKDTIKAMGLRCPGKQPWQYVEGRTMCSEEPVILQRGASNLYFANVRSVIDIPPESMYDEFGELTLSITNHAMFPVVKSDPDGPIADYACEAIAAELHCSAEQVKFIARQELAALAGGGGIASSSDLETDEWRAFMIPQREPNERDTFITRHVDLLSDTTGQPAAKAILAMSELVDKVVLATRLREVRALTGFTRYDVGGEVVRPDLGKGLDWLPAIEVFGEGIFFSLREDRLAEWEQDPTIVEIADRLERRRREHFIGSRLKPAAARFLLLHTLAHLVIRQLAHQCGYSSASLRERIYATSAGGQEPQAGLLVYTAAGDVEGTMGGLVRQGEPDALAHTLLAALERAAWCSSDPICRESRGQGFGNLNLGACHACALVSETSCETANVLLDRRLLIGTEGVPGFFEEVVHAARVESAASMINK